jgi:hypothetical protein
VLFSVFGVIALVATSCHFQWISFLRRSAHTGSLDYLHVANHCPNVEPINEEEYLDRQSRLVNLLRDSGAAAYIAEPGASAAYFGNISFSNWKLSERPLLFIIDASSQVYVLTPKVIESHHILDYGQKILTKNVKFAVRSNTS